MTSRIGWFLAGAVVSSIIWIAILHGFERQWLGVLLQLGG
jgi:hypothetical protein